MKNLLDIAGVALLLSAASIFIAGAVYVWKIVFSFHC